jgi:excisionase family DNA binding protein
MSAVHEKDVLNVEETAEFLGFAPYTIREKAKDGEIPGRKIGGEWRFSRRQLLEWVEEGDREQVGV